MATVTDYEHQRLARGIEGIAALAHEPDDCEMCRSLDLRRRLYGLAEEIKAAGERRVNGTPHEHGPKADPQDDPPPADPPSDPPPATPANTSAGIAAPTGSAAHSDLPAGGPPHRGQVQ
jgi:hypothetical protein